MAFFLKPSNRSTCYYEKEIKGFHMKEYIELGQNYVTKY